LRRDSFAHARSEERETEKERERERERERETASDPGNSAKKHNQRRTGLRTKKSNETHANKGVAQETLMRIDINVNPQKHKRGGGADIIW